MSRHLPVLQARLISFEARLDAARRRVKVSPGQLALDLTSSSAGAGRGPGGGERCGAGWIDPKKTCRKGEGGDPIDRPYEAKRSKPKETIVFPEPIVGPSGAKLTAYTWQWTLTEDVDHRGEPVEKRVSDWEKSIANVETGRNVVHQFQVEVGGETRTVSAESALKLMGFLSETDRKAFGSLKSSARTVARLRMAQQELDQQEKRWQKDWDEVGAMPRPALEVGEWSEEPPGWPREGYRRRSWRAGEVQQDQIWNQLGVDTDQEQEAHIWARWKAVEMEKRGWDYTGQGQTAMRGYLRRNREDLAKRLARAEAKLMAQTRSDATDRIDSLLTRLDALAAMLKAVIRSDTAMAQPGKERSEEAQEPSGGIDWANVNSEARTMVKLNRSANEAWQAMQQKGKQKPQD